MEFYITPLMAVLAATAVVAGVLGHWRDTIFIAGILCANIIIDMVHQRHVARKIKSLHFASRGCIKKTFNINGLGQTARLISAFLLLFIAAVFVLGLWLGISHYELAIAMVALFVAVVPESLPLTVTAVLLRAVHSLERQGLLIQHEHAIELLAKTDTLLLDPESATLCADAPQLAAQAATLGIRVIVAPEPRAIEHVVTALGNQHVDADVTIALSPHAPNATTAAGVITGHSCTILTQGFIQGRRAFSAVRRVILYLFSCNASEAALIPLALLTGLPLPLTAVQILWINVVTDGIMDFALSRERDEYIGPCHQHLFTPNLIASIILLAGAQTIAALGVFWLSMPYGIAYAHSMVVLTMVAAQWFNAWNCRSEYRSLFKMNVRQNLWLVGTTVGLVLLQMLVMSVSPLRILLNLVPLGLSDIALCVTASSCVLWIGQLRVALRN